MVDNFDIITRFVQNIYENDNNIYFHLQILQRKKDGNDIGSNSRLIKTYQIDKEHPLPKYKDRIISYCKEFNARAYINLSPKSKESTAVQMLHSLADCFRQRNFHYLDKLWNSAAGQVGGVKNYWIIDCDYSEDLNDRTINDMINFIDRNCKPDGIKFVTCIPTKNEKHIITTPFDARAFREAYPNIDIHKNNPTILFIN